MCRCNGGVDTALRLDHKGGLRFAALHSEAGRQLLRRSGRSPDDLSSIVLVEERGSFIKSEAILRIAEHLDAPLPVLAKLGFPFPLFIRDSFYDTVGPAMQSVTQHLLWSFHNASFISLPHCQTVLQAYRHAAPAGLGSARACLKLVLLCNTGCEFAIQHLRALNGLPHEG